MCIRDSVPVHIIDEAFLKRVIDDNPFNTSDTDHSKLYFCFLYSSPKPDLKAKLRDTIFENEKFFMTDNIVYLYFPMGFGKAKMNNNFIENKLKVTASTRNWRTTQKLFHLLKEVKCE
jgi:uncharacterized protein (DUF1697 family)